MWTEERGGLQSIGSLESDTATEQQQCSYSSVSLSLLMNKASGGDGIPVELFQILKDDAIKVLHSTCQQTWKTQQ